MDKQVIAWIIGAVIGVGLNAVMLFLTGPGLGVARTHAERAAVWTDIVQWSMGAAVKVIAVFIGVVALSADPQGNSFERWCFEWRGEVIVYGLILMVYLMDARDGLLIFLWFRVGKLLFAGGRHA